MGPPIISPRAIFPPFHTGHGRPSGRQSRHEEVGKQPSLPALHQEHELALPGPASPPLQTREEDRKVCWPQIELAGVAFARAAGVAVGKLRASVHARKSDLPVSPPPTLSKNLKPRKKKPRFVCASFTRVTKVETRRSGFNAHAAVRTLSVEVHAFIRFAMPW